MVNRKKQDSLTYGEFSRLTSQNTNPTEDSPGDTADDEMKEILIGMDYDEESLDELRNLLEDEEMEPEDEEEEKNNHPEKIQGETIDLLGIDSGVIFSKTE